MEKSNETKKNEVKNNIDNKKFIFILVGVLVVALVIGGIVGVSLSSGGSGNGKTTIKEKILGPKVKVVKNEASSIEYEKYDNGLVSMQIPKGWKVEVPAVDYIHYSFKVSNPNDPTYMFIFNMKFEGFTKTNVARNWQQQYYPTTLFAKLPAIEPQTTEAFYKVWNETADYANTYDFKYAYLPKLNDFTIIENLGTNSMVGGDILRATYHTDSGVLAQGIFTASVMSAGTYYVNSNPFNLFSEKIDVWPLNVYNIVFMSAPDEEFINWQSIFDHCIGSIAFSDTFVSGFNKEESSILTTIQANQQIYNQMSDMIMDSWEKRNNSYDIMSQKQSDATLGYERVYDTETGDIYKATNGFMDSYDGTRYQSITDDMYNQPTSGYIEKVG